MIVARLYKVYYALVVNNLINFVEYEVQEIAITVILKKRNIRIHQLKKKKRFT